mmetsp:Transcript_20393/g.42830  ORF Transcript_20393/g.42830 Transcript_20393/m.42830 type:complete len:406 (-) Transcript_20393:70-1287(-)
MTKNGNGDDDDTDCFQEFLFQRRCFYEHKQKQMMVIVELQLLGTLVYDPCDYWQILQVRYIFRSAEKAYHHMRAKHPILPSWSYIVVELFATCFILEQFQEIGYIFSSRIKLTSFPRQVLLPAVGAAMMSVVGGVQLVAISTLTLWRGCFQPKALWSLLCHTTSWCETFLRSQLISWYYKKLVENGTIRTILEAESGIVPQSGEVDDWMVPCSGPLEVQNESLPDTTVYEPQSGFETVYEPQMGEVKGDARNDDKNIRPEATWDDAVQVLELFSKDTRGTSEPPQLATEEDGKLVLELWPNQKTRLEGEQQIQELEANLRHLPDLPTPYANAEGANTHAFHQNGKKSSVLERPTYNSRNRTIEPRPQCSNPTTFRPQPHPDDPNKPYPRRRRPKGLKYKKKSKVS